MLERKKCYNEQGFRTNYVRSSILTVYCSLYVVLKFRIALRKAAFIFL